MLFSDLVILLRIKGYEYLEEKAANETVVVYAVKGRHSVYLGAKEVIFKSDINFFVKNEAYQKL